jgi:hypothetical protein
MFKIYFLLPLIVPLALMKRDFSMGLFRRVERRAGWLAARPWRAVALVGLFSFLLSAGLSFWARVPVPQTHDEFGYLLLGDTFTHGRITNPTPPLWQHFETVHEIMRPTYTAKYPPGQGVALAFGELLGLPAFGVWLSTALACAVICWMFMAWMPPRWALAGGLMVALHPLILQWSHSYWGGAVAMGGGALVLGAFRRIVRAPRARDAVWLGVGLGVLANSRPFEGFVVGTTVLLALLIWFVKAGHTPLMFQRVALPLAGVLICFGAQLAFYNWRVTGDPLVMPYVVHEQTYGFTPLFLFGKPRPEPAYLHPEIRKLHEEYFAYFESQRSSLGALLAATADKFWTLAQGYLWSWLMVVPLLALPWALKRDRWLWFAILAGVVFTAATLAGTFVFPHYAAPAAALFFVVVMLCMRRLNAWHIGTRRIGRNIVRGLTILFVASVFQVGAKIAAQDPSLWYFQRQALIEKLRAQPGKNLVIVRYEPDHNPNREWVYNEADIPDAKVILARDMGAKNAELLNYYRDRKAWIVDADAPEPVLTPLTGS